MLWSAPAQGRSIKTQEVFYEKAIAFVSVDAHADHAVRTAALRRFCTV